MRILHGFSSAGRVALVVHLAWILMTIFRCGGIIVVFVGVAVLGVFLLALTPGPRMAVFQHLLGIPPDRKTWCPNVVGCLHDQLTHAPWALTTLSLRSFCATPAAGRAAWGQSG